MQDQLRGIIESLYPYAESHGILRRLPAEGRRPEGILAELTDLARQEDQIWESGKCSGTMYSGDRAHYNFLNQVFSLFSHVNALQRDMCPSMTRFESDIISMTASLLSGDRVSKHHPGQSPCGSMSFGGTESIINPLLAYRDKAREERGIDRAHIVIADTAHPAFMKGAHLLGLEVTVVSTESQTTRMDPEAAAQAITPRTVALVGSAGNYPYGTVDDISGLSDLAVEHDIWLHVDACLGGFILPFGEALGIDIPPFDFRLPGVTSISADTHKYGYGLKGTSVVLYRDSSFRRYQYFITPDWKGGAYASPGLAGSRSGGLIAATWASMVSLGWAGYLEKARQIFATADAMHRSVRKHSALRLMGEPTFCVSFTADGFDIYHVNDFMAARGWRFNGQQNPAAIHMTVTGPQTQPGIREAFDTDLSEAVEYAAAHRHDRPRSSPIYGTGSLDLPIEGPEAIRWLLEAGMDVLQGYPF